MVDWDERRVRVLVQRLEDFRRECRVTTLAEEEKSRSPFRLLVACVISLRTKDEVTAEVEATEVVEEVDSAEEAEEAEAVEEAPVEDEAEAEEVEAVEEEAEAEEVEAVEEEAGEDQGS